MDIIISIILAVSNMVATSISVLVNMNVEPMNAAPKNERTMSFDEKCSGGSSASSIFFIMSISLCICSIVLFI